MAVGAGLLSLSLPETVTQSMPVTLKDLDRSNIGQYLFIYSIINFYQLNLVLLFPQLASNGTAQNTSVIHITMSSSRAT